MQEISSQAPIGGQLKTKKISSKGLLYEIQDGKDHYVYPTLPGTVIDIDDDEITIEHKKFVDEDIVSIYVIDGDIKVKKSQPVNQQTILGVTDDEVEFFVKQKGFYIDAQAFIGKKFNSKNDMSIEQRVKCFMKNLIAAPYKAGGMKKDDPCWSMYHKDETPQVDTTTPEDTEDGKEPEKPTDKNLPELPSGDQKGLPSGQKGLPSGDQKGLPSGDKEKSFWDDIVQDVDFDEILESEKKQNLIEEISRIKELLK